MNLNKKLRTLLIVWSNILFQFFAFAQNLEETYSFANQQFETENITNAITAYRRVLFFDNGRYSFNSCLNLAKCYQETNDMQKAQYFYDLAYDFASDDSVKNEIIFKKVTLLIKTEEYDFAMMELLNLPDSLNKFFYMKREFYSGIISFQKGEYEQSLTHVINCMDAGNTDEIKQIQQYYKKTNRIIKRYNPKTATYLSIFFPGLGQLYAGDYKNAINSFILVSSFAYLFVYVNYTYSLLDGILTVFPWYERYYMGGISSATKIARNKREKELSIIYEKIVDCIASTKK